MSDLIKRPVEWPDAARHVSDDICKLCDAADTLREEFGMMREGYAAAQEAIARLERECNDLTAALEPLAACVSDGPDGVEIMVDGPTEDEWKAARTALARLEAK